MVLIANLLNDLIQQSEKASNIARLIRDNDELFGLLIEKKDEKSKNQRFIVDFKTLADVLIQQSIKYHLIKKYPKIYAIKGEETNQFTNSKGITVNIELNDNPNDLEKLLNQVLIDHSNAAKLLTDIIYKDNSQDVCPINETMNEQLSKVDLNEDDIGIWIDPIDSTNEFIKSKQSDNNQIGSLFSKNGLACVTCLIGVFSKENGKSIIGVINLPFFNYNHNSYDGKYIWGVNYERYGHKINLNNIKQSDYRFEQQEFDSKTMKKKLVLSPAESEKIINKLKDDFELHFVTGQGYKLFLLLTNQVDLFLTTRSTTYKWDTCAASAIIKSIKNKSKETNNHQSGSLLELKSLAKDFDKNNLDKNLDANFLSKYELHYNSDEDLINQNGLIASLDNKLIIETIDRLKDSLL